MWISTRQRYIGELKNIVNNFLVTQSLLCLIECRCSYKSTNLLRIALRNVSLPLISDALKYYCSVDRCSLLMHEGR